jgi:hypothetical protein
VAKRDVCIHPNALRKEKECIISAHTLSPPPVVQDDGASGFMGGSVAQGGHVSVPRSAEHVSRVDTEGKGVSVHTCTFEKVPARPLGHFD